ncbi:hypothetical protein RV15_GL002708 [Enterococcus silesiacus]|uniref:Transposase n=2 Tax=Enterococcus silesiacus TaxID=332949 RepID=A0AA91GLX8_9ENTE|nr:hypothetical protein RV15_GL002708 [Enterococcus silesiacus]
MIQTNSGAIAKKCNLLLQLALKLIQINQALPKYNTNNEQ